MRRAALLCSILVGFTACGDDGNSDGNDDAPDAFVPTWWQPKPGENKNWDAQLHAPFDVSADRSVYMLDLFAVAPAGSIMEADGSMVAVLAGPLAGKIDELHARASKPKIICAIGTGTIRLSDPDASKFPGFKANPPDSPTPPEPGSVIGWSSGTPDDRHLDIRAATRGTWLPLVHARYAFAKSIGCDAIMPDGNDSRLASGFTGPDPTPEDQNSLYMENATAIHALDLSAGHRKNIVAASAIDTLQPSFDWVVPEGCVEGNYCDQLRPYLQAQKAVFAIDFQIDPDAMTGVDPTTACNRFDNAGIEDGIVKDTALSSAFVHTCD